MPVSKNVPSGLLSPLSRVNRHLRNPLANVEYGLLCTMASQSKVQSGANHPASVSQHQPGMRHGGPKLQ